MDGYLLSGLIQWHLYLSGFCNVNTRAVVSPDAVTIVEPSLKMGNTKLVK